MRVGVLLGALLILAGSPARAATSEEREGMPSRSGVMVASMGLVLMLSSTLLESRPLGMGEARRIAEDLNRNLRSNLGLESGGTSSERAMERRSGLTFDSLDFDAGRRELRVRLTF